VGLDASAEVDELEAGRLGARVAQQPLRLLAVTSPIIWATSLGAPQVDGVTSCTACGLLTSPAPASPRDLDGPGGELLAQGAGSALPSARDANSRG
jgi:hypothetical protein